MTDYAQARRNMVDNQLRTNRIEEPRLLAAMGEIPRELFCPPSLRGCAYGDEDIDLGDGRHLIEPLALAKLVQAAAPRPADVALVLGCDTGYGAAVLARLVDTVFLLVPPRLDGEAIERRLAEIECNNVVLQPGEPRHGLPAQAPFDVILLGGAVHEVPRALLDQLAEGGRLAAVVQEGRAGKVTLCRKVGGAVGRLTPFDAAIPPLPELQPEPAFVF
jgi:protein-L-isoaspartate(D-aspartate) O-methyltransferase